MPLNSPYGSTVQQRGMGRGLMCLASLVIVIIRFKSDAGIVIIVTRRTERSGV